VHQLDRPPYLLEYSSFKDAVILFLLALFSNENGPIWWISRPYFHKLPNTRATFRALNANSVLWPFLSTTQPRHVIPFCPYSAKISNMVSMLRWSFVGFPRTVFCMSRRRKLSPRSFQKHLLMLSYHFNIDNSSALRFDMPRDIPLLQRDNRNIQPGVLKTCCGESVTTLLSQDQNLWFHIYKPSKTEVPVFQE
jgi:hypothetical protein